MDDAAGYTGPEWERLLGIDGVGEVLARSLVGAFADDNERASIDRLVAHLDVEDAEPPIPRAARWRARRWCSPAIWSG